jgi:hypothetical protein
MEDKVQQKIAEAARAEYGWQGEEVRVDEVERLRRPSCSFYTAANAVRPLSYQANYAMLPKDQLAGIGDGTAVAKILDTCSSGASADWWAEIITRFHADLGGGIVLTDAEVRPDIVRKMDKAGMTFAPPAFGHDKQSVTFLLLDPERYILYRVEAKRSAGGPIEVTKTKLLGGTAGAQSGSQPSSADPVDSITQMLM